MLQWKKGSNSYGSPFWQADGKMGQYLIATACVGTARGMYGVKGKKFSVHMYLNHVCIGGGETAKSYVPSFAKVLRSKAELVERFKLEGDKAREWLKLHDDIRFLRWAYFRNRSSFARWTPEEKRREYIWLAKRSRQLLGMEEKQQKVGDT